MLKHFFVMCLGMFLSTLVLFAQNSTPYQASDGKWGYKDAMGNIVIQPQYEQAFNFYEGRAGVMIDGKFGYINSQGDVCIKPQYEIIGRFSEGLAIVGVKNKLNSAQYIDLMGQIFARIVIPASDNIIKI